MSKNAAWKAHERRIARRLGGRRVGPTGAATPDVVTDQLAVECKHRATLPAWLAGAMAQAVDNAPEDLTPVVVLHEHGKRADGDLVIVRLADFERLIEE